MKKLIILNLALAMASTALADLSLFYEAGTVTLVGSDYTTAEPITCFLAVSCTTEVPVLLYEGTGSGITYPPPDGIDYYETLLGLDPNTLDNVYMVNLEDTTEPYSIPNGELVMTTITGLGDVYLLDESGTLMDQVTVPTCRDMIQYSAELDLYDRYVDAGQDPSCWCWQYQCRGDASNSEESIFISGTYRVYQQDLSLLIKSWKKNPETGADPCADICHDEETVFISGTYSVYQNDLGFLIGLYWKKTTAEIDTIHGDGSPGSGACATYLPWYYSPYIPGLTPFEQGVSLDVTPPDTINLVGSGFTVAEPGTVFMVFTGEVNNETLLYPGYSHLVDRSEFSNQMDTILDLPPGKVKEVWEVIIQDLDPYDDIPNGNLASFDVQSGSVYLQDSTGQITLDRSYSNLVPPPCRERIPVSEEALYDRYVAAGKDPSCWCNQYQCHGDVTDFEETVFISGTYRVYQADLNVMIGNWLKTPETGADPAADVDHAEETVFLTGTYSVYQADLNELIINWKKTTAEIDAMYGDGSPGSGACPTYQPWY